jgi:integrase
MARAARNSIMESRTARLKLAPRKAPYRVKLDRGQAVAYYRPAKGAGSWIAFVSPSKVKEEAVAWRQCALGVADDLSDADGINVLTYSQACAKARKWFDTYGREARMRVLGEDIPEGPYTVAQAMTDYLLEQCRRGKKGITQAEHATRAHILPELGEIEVAKLTAGKLKRWLDALATAPRRVRTSKIGTHIPVPRKFKVPRQPKAEPVPPAPPSTEDEKRARRDSANRIWTSLRAALNLALKSGRVSDGSAWKGVKSFEGTTSARIRHLTIADQVRLVNACPPDLRRLVTGALHTGARFGELISLEVRDLDVIGGTVHVAAHIAKTGKPRNVVLTAEGRTFFESITAGRGAGERIFLRDDVTRRKREAVGHAWGRSDQKRPLDAACKDAGIDRATFHELRHTAASTWINAGMSLGDVAEQLGDSERTTRKHYIHLCPSALAARVRQIAPVLGINEPDKIENLKIGS